MARYKKLKIISIQSDPILNNTYIAYVIGSWIGLKTTDLSIRFDPILSYPIQ